MREMLDRRNRTDVKRVARIGLIRADAALTENDVRIALIHDVLGGVQPLVDGRRQPALQHDGLSRASDRLQEAEVLHIACTDLQQICVGSDRIHRLDYRDLCHDGKPRLLTRLGEVLQPLLLKALERIG